MLVNKIHFRPKMQWMICTMLYYVRSVSLDIWHIERYVCFWPLWFSKHTLSFTATMFSSVCVWFSSVCRSHAFGRCCMFPKSLLITFPLFPHCKLSSKILPVLSKNCIFKPLQVLIRALSPLLNGTLHHRYIVSALKIIIHYNIICLWFVYKHQKCI